MNFMLANFLDFLNMITIFQHINVKSFFLEYV